MVRDILQTAQVSRDDTSSGRGRHGLGHEPLHRACPGCHVEGTHEKMESHGLSDRLECGSCGLQFWWPLSRANAQWYAEHGTTTADWSDSLVRPGHRRFLKKPPLESGRLLDIGCGHGLFLSLVRDKVGLDAWGLDWDVQGVEFGRRYRKLEHLYAQSLEDFHASTGGEQFDAVTLFEVLEHQENPSAFLKLAAAFIKPSGVLTGSVPNRTRLVVGPREEWDYPPQHLLWFDRHSLASLLQRSGFEFVTIHSILDAGVLVNQILARYSFGLASRIVRMPEAPVSNVLELNESDWKQLKSKRRLSGYGMTTMVKKIALAPILVPALLWGTVVPSVRHTLYFEARRTEKSA